MTFLLKPDYFYSLMAQSVNPPILSNDAPTINTSIYITKDNLTTSFTNFSPMSKSIHRGSAAPGFFPSIY